MDVCQKCYITPLLPADVNRGYTLCLSCAKSKQKGLSFVDKLRLKNAKATQAMLERKERERKAKNKVIRIK